ncbi:MAG: pyruvate ferredoxin oxidoreductase [Armatimonadota bacterium]|nr:pyruvate ferredoxin oxidoreductase [Armatimonadota bacterium]MDR7448573.1 pyruvate ferredoxin oxidoreductase [Armatimonadota bacterium]MDR7458939.1 pyruvate ferredoxin oxidoreductase [Armatimonadota bacterium]MDR7478915.1 pyruvate ferredoxin oxidoreductase [Armatimonadota bacterium]MDR7489540.1 pyruvate ferredoxin oxidoreductase [Armatimonadota bacterium]
MARVVEPRVAPGVEEQEREELISGSEAIAVACKLADVDVITAYPIRPYDTVMQYVAKLVANGQLDCEYIVAESEHSQFEIVKHASAAGARVFCGSSGVGWMYAFEALTVTPALRIPMVAMVGNRALDDPGAFGVEHNDALAVRDLGWMLVWVDTAQEALDTALIAYRVAEDRRVFLPCAIACDGAFLTHSQAIVKVPPQAWVDRFLPPYDRGDLLLHPDNPITVAPQVNEDWLMELRKQNDEAMKRARTVIAEAYREFEAIFGRAYGNPFFEEYQTADADVVLVGMGTLSMPVKVAIRRLRQEGHRVGLVRLRWFRPFPTEELQATLSRFRAVGVIDRDYAFGSPYTSGVVANEVRAALYDAPQRPPVVGFISGLGGREVTVPDVYRMVALLEQAAAGTRVAPTHWIGIRE